MNKKASRESGKCGNKQTHEIQVDEIHPWGFVGNIKAEEEEEDDEKKGEKKI